MISFIIPTKNEKKIIATTLEKILKYTGPKEIIVSDGNSTDGTIEIIKKYTDKMLIYSGKEKRQNISQGKNDGAKIATGDYLVFMDADTSVENPDAFFTKAISEFKKDPKLGALTVNIKVLKEFETIGDKIVFGMMNWMNRFYNNVCGIGASTGEFQMVKRDIFNKVNGFNEAFAAGEDYDLFRRISKLYSTRADPSLTSYHTGRRAHAIGWPKLLSQWFMNFIYTLFLNKSASSEWGGDIR
ncbi:MAG: glycosyltransferase [bacterium]